MKILFIQTGGTIDKDYPKLISGYAFEITKPAVSRILKRIKPSFEYEILPLFQKDSLDLSDDDRNKIHKIAENSTFDKIIITHGTDSMIETAKRLSSIKNKTIIVTGAMRPERFSNSDAHFNIGVAIGALNILNSGVFLAMNGRIFEADKVKRNPDNGRFEALI